ncbi:lipopolysaccharide assembly protein LapA domain-containing protein [Bowmanella dokdonensis]|uniref:LapA family protein n=1 Tax=Bowmanella dokdonensis TaxID=751969 RepID=A0A939DME9_9ALTE|nr:LapA family protein [Bowmanella dokdonensis]MBN7824496.1 LapA family protein [Bowmanella dokdonensis]
MKLVLSLLLTLAVFLLALTLGAQNDQLIQVNYLIAQTQMRVSSLMAIMFLLGVAVSLSVSLLWFIGFRWRHRHGVSKSGPRREP